MKEENWIEAMTQNTDFQEYWTWMAFGKHGNGEIRLCWQMCPNGQDKQEQQLLVGSILICFELDMNLRYQIKD